MLSPDESALTHYPRAVAALEQGDAGAAFDAVEGQSDAAARRVAGRALLVLGDRSGARRAFEEALTRADRDPAAAALAHEGLASVARATGELGEAAAHLTAALGQAPPAALHHLHREAAGLAQRRGNLLAAERHAAHALATAGQPGGPIEASDRVRLGSILGDLGRHEDAIDELSRATHLLIGLYGPAHVEVAAAQTELAAALEAAGRLDEAQAQHERVLAHRAAAIGAEHPSLAPRLLALSAITMRRGDPDRARAWAQRAAQILAGRVPADDPLLRRALELAGAPRPR